MRNVRDHYAGGNWLETQAGAPNRSVVVNGVRHSVPRGFIRYADVARLAGKPDARNLTIQYSGGVEGKGGRGTLTCDDSVIVVDDMEFDAVFTGNA